MGGAGADTISVLAFDTTSSINGGSGNDSIYVATAGSVLAYAAGATINGGDGTDTISIASTGGLGFASANTIVTGVASIVYQAGDVIQLLTTALTGGEAFGGIVFNGSETGFADNTISAVTAGSLNVYSDGTDTFFAYAQTAGSGIAFKVSGADLVTTAAVSNSNNAAGTTANFGFTVSGTVGTGITITLA